MQMNEKIENERFLLLQKQSPFMFLGSLLGGLGLIASLWSVIPHAVLLSWYAALAVYWIFRLLHSIYQLRELHSRSPTRNEKKYFYVYPATSGVFWAAAGVLFFTPDHPMHFSYLLMYLFGMILGASVSLAYIRWAFPLYATIVITPIVVLLLMDDNQLFFWIAVTLTFSLLMIAAISNNVHRSISESLKIRFENESLVAKLKRKTRELEKQKEVAIKANEDKSRFLASASHDLRQPIHSLSLLTDALDTQITTKEGKSILALVHNANDSLNSLLGSLLDVSKLDAGIVEPRIERVSLTLLLNRVIDNYRLSAKQKGLQLRLHLNDCYIDCDPSLLSNALMNLIDNAIKYTFTGGVLISTRIYDERVKIQVWDTGVGIAKDNQEKIYGEFLQLGNPERDIDKGLGLGLSISKRILQLLDYPLSLSSKVGRGSVFSILVPLSALSIEEECKVKEESTYNLDEERTYTVLLIDDNKIVRKSSVLALESWGYDVLSASCLEEVELIAKNKQVSEKVDVIVSDYRLQENMTGIDAIKSYKQLTGRNDLPAFLITGDTAPERLKEATSFGLPLLHKPLKQGAFKVVLRNLLCS